MSEQIDQIRNPLTRAQRKQLLVLACAADRARWVHECRPQPNRSPVGRIVTELMGFVEPFSHFLPRRLGGWIRSASFLTGLGRKFGWIGR